jgi:hypothetical protein
VTGGRRRSRTLDREVGPVFKTGCVPPRAAFRAGCPGATRTRDPRSRKAVLCSTELRDRNGQGGWIRTNGLLRPRQALSPD